MTKKTEMLRLLRLAWGAEDVSAEDCKKIDALLAAPAEDVSAVVDEPTDEMCEAGCQAYMKADGSQWVMHKSSMAHAFKAMHALRHPQEPVATLDPVHGDLLPPVGSTVQIQLGDSGWFDHTVTGYYAWDSHGLNKNVHRVFVRVKDAAGTPNARMLNEIRQPPPTTSQ